VSRFISTFLSEPRLSRSGTLNLLLRTVLQPAEAVFSSFFSIVATAAELFSIPGVYLGMFEQSILAGDTVANKTRALAASLGVQSLAVAVAILIPLIFADRLPRLQPWIATSLPLRAQPQPQPVKTTAIASSAPSMLHAPVRTIDLSLLNPHRPELVGATILSDSDTFSSSVAGVGMGLDTSISSALPTTVAIISVQPPPAAPVTKAPDKPHQVGGDVQAAKLIRKIIPQYPPLAKQARVSGTVQLTGVIAKDGTIEQLQVVSGNPLLVPAALAAVKQWLYRPTFLNGQPVEVIAPIDVIFTLSR
jgi:periplasmic protein TonB